MFKGFKKSLPVNGIGIDIVEKSGLTWKVISRPRLTQLKFHNAAIANLRNTNFSFNFIKHWWDRYNS